MPLYLNAGVFVGIQPKNPFSAFCFSSEFCEAHLQLLFTILEKAPQATIRANTIVAVGDLTFRFPNLIEPWTSHLYARYVQL